MSQVSGVESALFGSSLTCMGCPFL
uniref:Uncharacterized protein n=1 Tax=Arundo donax TaxID=35708 RepID=A0A0A9BH63_ARUDO